MNGVCTSRVAFLIHRSDDNYCETGKPVELILGSHIAAYIQMNLTFTA
jgi:hypothetical protein